MAVINEKLNWEYDSNIPYISGDRYYPQDAIKDKWWLTDRAGLISKDVLETIPCIISGGKVTTGILVGGEYSLNITACIGYVEYDVEIMDSFASTPPTKKTVQLNAIRVSSIAQTNLDISGTGTFDGATTNYVKLSYDEANSQTRDRAKATGNYNYELTSSFAITVDAVAPTNKDIVLASFTAATGVQPVYLEGDRSSIINNINSQNFYGNVRRNAIINGGMEIWQRQTTFAAVASVTYTADMWQYFKSGTMVHTITRDTDVQDTDNTNYSLKIDCTTADATIAAGDFCYMRTGIEGYDFKKFVNQTATLSFWVKSTKIGVFCVSFVNSAADRSYVAEYEVFTTNTWEYKTITLNFNYSGGTWNYTNGVGILIHFPLAMGSTFHTTADTWQTGAFYSTANQVNACDNVANDFLLSNVQFNLGSVPLAFEYRRFTDELALCQRYYEKTYNYSVFPTAASLPGTISFEKSGTTVNQVPFSLGRFAVMKRTVPTIVWYNPNTGAVNNVVNGGGALAVSSNADVGDTGPGYPVTTATAADQNILKAHYTADASF